MVDTRKWNEMNRYWYIIRFMLRGTWIESRKFVWDMNLTAYPDKQQGKSKTLWYPIPFCDTLCPLESRCMNIQTCRWNRVWHESQNSRDRVGWTGELALWKAPPVIGPLSVWKRDAIDPALAWWWWFRPYSRRNVCRTGLRDDAIILQSNNIT